MKMPHKIRVSLTVAAVIVAAAVPAGLLYGSPVGASTAACGTACTSPSVESQGTGEVLAVSGNSIVLASANTTSSTQDWTPLFEGPVSGAVSAGVVSAKLDMNYSGADLEEFEYAPNGAPSDECLANTASTSPSTDWYEPTLNVALEPCGITAQSLWILDGPNASNGYLDLINAGYETQSEYANAEISTSNANLTSPFAEPEVLTYNSSGKVVLAPLSEIGGVVSTSQMWADWSAPAQGALRAAVAKSRLKIDRFR
jgi:hypothetical protein